MLEPFQICTVITTSKRGNSNEQSLLGKYSALNVTGLKLKECPLLVIVHS